MEEREEDFEGFAARVVQHEWDHLLGKHIFESNVSHGDIDLDADQQHEVMENMENVLLSESKIRKTLQQQGPNEVSAQVNMKSPEVQAYMERLWKAASKDYEKLQVNKGH